MTPTERESLHPPDVVEAWHWLDIHCRHWATVGHDTQTIDNLNNAERITARQHLGTLRRLGMLREGGFRGNFETLPYSAIDL